MPFVKAGAAVAIDTAANMTLYIEAIHTTEKATLWHIVVPGQAPHAGSHTKLLNRNGK